jgi:hypothetical protein
LNQPTGRGFGSALTGKDLPMYTDHHLAAGRLDRLFGMIENYATLLDEEFDQDLYDLESEVDALRHLLNH